MNSVTAEKTILVNLIRNSVAYKKVACRDIFSLKKTKKTTKPKNPNLSRNLRPLDSMNILIWYLNTDICACL